MKKIFMFLLLFVAIFSLAGCDKAVGEWKVHEIEVMGTTFQVGEKVLGQEITEDMLILKFNMDNTGERSSVSGNKTTTETFTWVKEGDVYKITIGDSVMEAKIVGDYLEIDYSGLIYRLSK